MSHKSWPLGLVSGTLCLYAGWLVVASVGVMAGPAPASSGRAVLASPAKTNSTFVDDWRRVRREQPHGLTLELRLPKATFYQGEPIEATLVFANYTTNLYAVDTRDYDRSGRLDDIAFFAAATDGQAVPDPLQWYFRLGSFGGGLGGGPAKLGKWRLTQIANQWLRFDRPGRYHLYAWAKRTTRGKADTEDINGPPIELVSGIRTVEIRPLAPNVEADILSRARTNLAQGGNPAAAAIIRLRYLQTPAARDLLRPLVEHHEGNSWFDAAFGLLGAPDPALEATPLLKAAKEPTWAVTEEFASLYSALKSYPAASKVIDASSFQEFERRRAEAGTEFATEIRAALPRKSGPALITTVIWLLSAKPLDQGFRELLLRNQEQLTENQITQIVEMWFDHSDGQLIGGKAWLGGKDLLPILRLAVQPPHSNPEALGCLLRASPEEAWPIITTDIASQKPKFCASPNCGALLEVMRTLPVHALPQLDPVFRRWLRDPSRDLDDQMAWLEHLGSTNQLADVVKFYQPREGKWAGNIQNCVLRYWIRCDPKEGVKALERALRARQKTGLYLETAMLKKYGLNSASVQQSFGFRTVLSQVLLPSWVPEAKSVVMAGLDDEDSEVVDSAAQVLERHSTIDDFPRVLAAVERLASVDSKDRHAHAAVQRIVTRLLYSRRWQLSPEQLTQLATSVKNPALKQQILQRRPSSR